jgi:hypothetical protein
MGLVIRTIDISRTTLKIAMANIVYNRQYEAANLPRKGSDGMANS